MDLKLYYATNRKHKGKNRWQPATYGAAFSSDGAENLRFGKVTVQVDKTKIQSFLNKNEGDGRGLRNYVAGKVKRAKIEAFEEKLDAAVADTKQEQKVLGSKGMFMEMQSHMRQGSDVLVYIHGYNMTWEKSVGAALSLELMLNHKTTEQSSGKAVRVVLFTWPSDGIPLPFVSYKSDRTEASGSGYAVGRALLKLRDFLQAMSRNADEACDQEMHLLCHSMGNFVLQNAVGRMLEFNTGRTLPRMFQHIFLCAADVDDNVLEANQPLGRLHEMCRNVTVYYNRDDMALHVSDFTKGNPERLGSAGVSRVSLLHNKVHQVDCTEKVRGILEHSYYLWGPVAADLRMNVDNVSLEAASRSRIRDTNHTNSWTLD